MQTLFQSNPNPYPLMVWEQPQNSNIWCYTDLFLSKLYQYKTVAGDLAETLASANVRTVKDFMNWLEANTQNFPSQNRTAVELLFQFWNDLLESEVYVPVSEYVPFAVAPIKQVNAKVRQSRIGFKLFE